MEQPPDAERPEHAARKADFLMQDEDHARKKNHDADVEEELRIVLEERKRGRDQKIQSREDSNGTESGIHTEMSVEIDRWSISQSSYIQIFQSVVLRDDRRQFFARLLAVYFHFENDLAVIPFPHALRR